MLNPLSTALAQARQRTDELFELIRPDAIYERPVPERHRLIFYLGHLEAFDWNQICRGALGVKAFHPEFDRLFAFGIDPPPGKLPQDQPSEWPSMREVREYNREVREILDARLPEASSQLVRVAIEHRLMHAETFAYLMHSLPYDRKLGRMQEEEAGRPAPECAGIEIPPGIATLGRKRDDGFGWDNEFDEHALAVPGFVIDRYKVTNGRYLDYVREGGSPSHFWVRRGSCWYYRAMFGEIPLPLDWPVYVTQAQARNYAQWAGKALPTEAQWHRAAYGTPEGTERLDPPALGNFDFRRWDPEPVTDSPESQSAFGVAQLIGNGWEWTSEVFGPLPGFEKFPFYPGYSADFFDGRHYVMKGGSPRTAAVLLRRSFRNWFRPEYPYAYAGFRCVEN